MKLSFFLVLFLLLGCDNRAQKIVNSMDHDIGRVGIKAVEFEGRKYHIIRLHWGSGGNMHAVDVTDKVE